ncbi:hypothetical protein EON65_57740 [archaeon]|nr:MAG: hypothetical protein EON65_57740 [archaeon]
MDYVVVKDDETIESICQQAGLDQHRLQQEGGLPDIRTAKKHLVGFATMRDENTTAVIVGKNLSFATREGRRGRGVIHHLCW